MAANQAKAQRPRFPLLTLRWIRPRLAFSIQIFLHINSFPDFTVQTLQTIRVPFWFRRQNNYTILNIKEQTISLFDTQFLACGLRNSDLILRADFDRSCVPEASFFMKIKT